jgi:hypothetical protein
MIHCLVAARFWATIVVVVALGAHVSDLHLLKMFVVVVVDVAPAFVPLCCW